MRHARCGLGAALQRPHPQTGSTSAEKQRQQEVQRIGSRAAQCGCGELRLREERSDWPAGWAVGAGGQVGGAAAATHRRLCRLPLQVIPALSGDATDQTPPDLPSYLFKERIVYLVRLAVGQLSAAQQQAQWLRR